MKTKQYAPWSIGITFIAASSRPWVFGASPAINVVTRSLSVLAEPTPTIAASSRVFTRLPLWPSATDRTPSVLNTGCAFSHVVEPVVE